MSYVQVMDWAKTNGLQIVGYYVAHPQGIVQEDIGATTKMIGDRLIQHGCSNCTLFVVRF
jgi:hypothetical protein